MTYLSPKLIDPTTQPGTLDLEVVIPVRNEQQTLVSSVETLQAHLAGLPYSTRITIADNASTDDTEALGKLLATRFKNVDYQRLELPGRGRALKKTWSNSDAAVVAYMDVDLSTDLAALLPLVAPLLSGHSDIAIGTRLDPGSRTVRGTKRELISRAYNLLLRGTLQARFSDAQCGFKAIRSQVARELLSLVEDDAWFFDTELLVLAERAGMRIHEVPVDWIDDPDSRVDVAKTAIDDLRGMWRIGYGLATKSIAIEPLRQRAGRATPETTAGGELSAQVVIFAIVGVCSTIAYALLFLLLRPLVGPQFANALSLVITAVANTAANRRFTFGISDPANRGRHHLQGLGVFAAGLLATSGSLTLLHAAYPGASSTLEMAVLTAANLLVTIVRFLAMRFWIFKPK